MLKNGTYHREIGLPRWLPALWVGSLELVYSEHAKNAARTDRYGEIPLHPVIEFISEDVVEVEVVDGQPVKAVLRIPIDDHVDGIYVILRPSLGKALVKTVWLNRASDKHVTLKIANYVRP